MSESLMAAAHDLYLASENDALDAMVSGLPACIFTTADVDPDFFDLRNGLAGAIFQKFVNYNYRVAFVVPANHDFGDRVTELIRDHARHPCVQFFSTVEEAEAWLT